MAKFIFKRLPNLGSLLAPLALAMMLLTRLPLGCLLPKAITIWTPENQSRSLMYYPVVGMFLAVVVTLLAHLLPDHFSPLLSATCVLASWVAVSGALHLDGLADSVDAASAAHGETNASEQEKILAVFKDPHVGAMAVVVVVICLLLKLAMIVELLDTLMLALALSMTLARALIIPLFLTTPYVRAAGLGSGISQAMPAKSLWASLLLSLCLPLIVLPWSHWLVVLLALALLLFFWRRFWMQKIKGFVGDCAGALIELTELLVLFVLCCL